MLYSYKKVGRPAIYAAGIFLPAALNNFLAVYLYPRRER